MFRYLIHNEKIGRCFVKNLTELTDRITEFKKETIY